jgi:hypothetical protein
MNPLMLPGGLGGRELILIAALVLLMVGVSRLTELQRARATVASHNGVDEPMARAYLDRLVGPASSRARPGPMLRTLTVNDDAAHRGAQTSSRR